MMASFGMLSGPMLFPRLSCLIVCLISLVVIGFGSGSFSIVLSVSFTVCCMCSVQCSYSSSPGRAWYRSRKYSLMWFFASFECQMYRCARYCVTQSVSPTVPENPSGPIVDYFLVLTCAAVGSQLCGLLPGVDRWSSLHDPRVIGSYHHKLWGWPLRYADFMWFWGGLKPEKSRRGPSFLVTQMEKRVL